MKGAPKVPGFGQLPVIVGTVRAAAGSPAGVRALASRRVRIAYPIRAINVPSSPAGAVGRVGHGPSASSAKPGRASERQSTGSKRATRATRANRHPNRLIDSTLHVI